jgi:hypothetical protein
MTASLRACAVSDAPTPNPGEDVTPLQIAQAGYDAWAAKPHNKKWVRRIDGTPIPNDLLVNIAEAFRAASNGAALGATNRYPQDVLNEDDEGELRMGVRRDPVDGLVHVDFGKPVAWLGLPPENAIALARALLKHAGGDGPVTLTIG